MDERPVLTVAITAAEFERESRRVDEDLWRSMALAKGEKVLFCGFPEDRAWLPRAAEIGAVVSVIESAEEKIASHADLPLTVLRGSTTQIPARVASFDVAVAYHYLHEIDPSFHTQVISELARVAKRVVIVELTPPDDPLGRRITALYSRAKHDFGSFETYQQPDYWKKLLNGVKADVVQYTVGFRKAPPKAYLEDTVAVLLRALENEDIPADYLAELRQLAKKPDGNLLPLARSVLVGAAAGELPSRNAVEPFYTPVAATADEVAAVREAVANARTRREYTDATSEADAPIMPPLPPPAAAAPPLAPPQAPESPQPAPVGFGAFAPPPPPPIPGGLPGAVPGPAPFVPFALPENEASPFGIPSVPPADPTLGWQWEPPEDPDAPKP
jgi:hypothetical protein